jgi:hypothetical protein
LASNFMKYLRGFGWFRLVHDFNLLGFGYFCWVRIPILIGLNLKTYFVVKMCHYDHFV